MWHRENKKQHKLTITLQDSLIWSDMIKDVFQHQGFNLKKIIVKSFATEKLSIFFLWNIIIDENRNGDNISCFFLSPPRCVCALAFDEWSILKSYMKQKEVKITFSHKYIYRGKVKEVKGENPWRVVIMKAA